MPFPILTPRVNNNDDQVRLCGFFVQTGQRVLQGQLLAEVETDKAVFEVAAEREGYVLALNGNPGDTIDVGTVLLWMGAQAGEDAPGSAPVRGGHAPVTEKAEPTAKARLMIQQYGLRADAIATKGNRLTTEDVEAYLRDQRATAPALVADAASAPGAPALPTALATAGESIALTVEERSMLRSVTWHRDEAVPAYLELAYDSTPWNGLATTFAEKHKLLMYPLLPLLAHQLAKIAGRLPRINSVIHANKRYQYATVNLGFTIQAGQILYLAVLRDAGSMARLSFIRALTDLQRRAIAHKLRSAEVGGATIGFTSMDRWQVSRHVPILPPHVSLMVAHTTDRAGQTLLGASYDHRLLTGADAADILRQLAVPEEFS
jgi:pyruvate/2-oxoglutarate dehydrogenase complex dihydrolipoamide acyltransferase (E2) component